MNNFKRVSAAALAGTTLALASGASYGLGFGRPTVRAILGEPLRVTTPLRLEAGEILDPECVSAEVLFGDEKLSPSQVVATLQSAPGRELILKVSTTALVNEPIVTYSLMAGCQAKITRTFVALADPPGMSMPEAASPMVPARRAAEPGSRAVASSEGDLAQRTRPVAVSPPVRAPGARKAARSEAGLAQSPAKALPPVSSKVQPQAERLVLDAVEADATVVPDLRMSSTLGMAASAEAGSPAVQAGRAAAAAWWQTMNLSPEQWVRDRQRLQAQEAQLAQLQRERDQARASLALIAAQSHEGPRAGVGWLYAIGLMAVLALGLCALMWRQLRRRQKQDQAWWQSGAHDASALGDDERASPHLMGMDAVRREVAPSTDAEAGAAVPVTPAVHLADSVAPEAGSDWRQDVPAMVPQEHTPAHLEAAPEIVRAQSVPPAPVEALRAVAVEELIDLAQQAEFFVVLGQDDAAVDLLESHVQSTTGASPLPFLKLLEIYQRLGQRADYERVQAEFNQRFNAHAPAWEADLQRGHTLGDYPGVIERLQALWATPAEAMAVLEKSLTRPERSIDTFDLPAYRELLLLYAVARDLSERDVQQRHRVDLHLPRQGGVEPLMATRPIKPMPEARPTLSLDLHLDDLQAAPSEHVLTSSLTLPATAAVSQIDFEHIDLPELDLGEHAVAARRA